jgi:iron complex transport system ATP-binding protein
MSMRRNLAELREKFTGDHAVDPRPPWDEAATVVVDDVHVRRGKVEVLHGVSLTVGLGELVALVGPNGAGKSTLLSAISGDLPVSDGSVELCGRDLEDWSPGDLARRRSVLLQQNDLAFSFSVDDVVRMGRNPWAGQPEEDGDDDAVTAAIEAADVTHLRERPFTELSGGERARVSLARVVAQDTPVLLLDEPTASLDLQHQEIVLSLARARADAGGAVVVVLHDLGLAGAYADRVAVMESGSLVALGTPAEVLTAELLTRVYRQRVEVFPHPQTGTPVIVAVR